METFTSHVAAADVSTAHVDDRLALPFEQRQKTRQRVVLESGREAAVVLPRGVVMRGGDRLRAESGCTIEVLGCEEPLSTVRTDNRGLLARIAYHLGNRHVWVEVGDGWLRYLEDHVLDAMVDGLGVTPSHDHAPFEPEAGAYGDHGHGSGHGHDH